jgi:hypothetical protein
MNVASASSAERAVYRAVQDLSAAIRFLKENASNFGIDTNYVFVGGSSAGAVASYHLTFMNEQQKPNSITSGFLSPDLGCINCEGNPYNHNTIPNAVIGFWGAIADTSFIEFPENNTPVIMFHGDQDLIVDYDYGIPFTLGITLPALYGSSNIAKRLSNLNIDHEFYTAVGEGHEYWGALNGSFGLTGPNANWYDMINLTGDFLYRLMLPSLPIISGNTNVPYGQTEIYTSNFSNNYEHCWTANGALQINPNGNQVEILWDSTQTTGNLYLTVKSPIHTVSNEANILVNNYFVSDNLNDFSSKIFLYPNPTKDILNIEIENISDSKGLTLQILDFSGRIVKTEILTNKINQIDLSEFRQGIYVVNISNENKIFLNKKISLIK